MSAITVSGVVVGDKPREFALFAQAKGNTDVLSEGPVPKEVRFLRVASAMVAAEISETCSRHLDAGCVRFWAARTLLRKVFNELFSRSYVRTMAVCRSWRIP